MALFGALFLALLAGAHAEIPGCKIRITTKALELGKAWGGVGAGAGGGHSSSARRNLGSRFCLSEAGGTALSGARAGDHHHSGPEGRRGPILLQHL